MEKIILFDRLREAPQKGFKRMLPIIILASIISTNANANAAIAGCLAGPNPVCAFGVITVVIAGITYTGRLILNKSNNQYYVATDDNNIPLPGFQPAPVIPHIPGYQQAENISDSDGYSEDRQQFWNTGGDQITPHLPSNTELPIHVQSDYFMTSKGHVPHSLENKDGWDQAGKRFAMYGCQTGGLSVEDLSKQGIFCDGRNFGTADSREVLIFSANKVLELTGFNSGADPDQVVIKLQSALQKLGAKIRNK